MVIRCMFLGSVDCTALTPLLRDQFPELLSTFPTPSSDQTVNRTSLSISCKKTQDLLVSESGCWIKLPIRIGFNEKIYAFVEVKKTISVPLSNTSKNWLLISIESVTLIHSNGSNLPGVKKNNQWNVSDFIEISMKDTIVSPESQKSLEVHLSHSLLYTIH